MWSIIGSTLVTLYIISIEAGPLNQQSLGIFQEQHMMFRWNYNITSILVSSDEQYVQSNDSPLIFFAVADSRFEGGSSLYVLGDIAPYEILEGGRDSTSDYGLDKSVYFGAKDGLYKYDPDTISARRYGIFRDDIIQLQKANGTDTIFILTAQRKLYKVQKEGTTKTKVDTVSCALEFVLDTSNNIYYIDCTDRMIHIIHANGIMHKVTASVMEEFDDVKLIRPAFLMEESIPFLGNGYLYFLFSNGTSEKTDFYLKDRPSAVSVDASLYLVAAFNGKVYEINTLDVLINSMFNVKDNFASDMSRAVASLVYTFKTNLYNFYNATID